ncbi:type II toxin-antitoxin system HicA family toxin [Patescibacteria group bacterium]|nr:type II toxin-antitoxin system HicA family toxin [Patescibacteria group bacterium]
MSTLANVKPREIERVLLKSGFLVQSAKGSHKTFKHPNGRRTTLAYHPGNIPKPIVAKILKQSGIPLEKFKKLQR